MATFNIPKTPEEVLKRYNLPVIHLRQQYRFNRIGLTLGAGVSVPLKYPSWDELVKRIAAKIPGADEMLSYMQSSTTVSKTQRLYEFYHKSLAKDSNENDRVHNERVENSWKRLLKECLYAESKPLSEKENKINGHPYLRAAIPILQKVNVVVNFNFDDTIEHLLEIDNRPKLGNEKKSRTSETRWDLGAPIRNDIPTIFHPNGYLAYNEHEYSSDNIIFAEGSFLKRMTQGRIGDDSVWLSEYINNTYIHVGLSLNDEILKALLQRAWSAAPANIHYQIHYSRGNDIDLSTKLAMEDANFRVLNLVTLFLGDEGTKSLFELVTMPDSQFEILVDQVGATSKFVYYVTGAVGSGKTTTVNQFKNFWAMDEWLEKSPEIISRPFDTLTNEERTKADEWVGSQFHIKNSKLHNKREAVVMVDRCPLDPLTFIEEGLMERAVSLQKQITPSARAHTILEGMVFVLEANPAELRVRLVRKWKFWDESTIAKLIANIRTTYSERPVYVDTLGLSIGDVSRLLLRRIFFEDYVPIRLDLVLSAMTKKAPD